MSEEELLRSLVHLRYNEIPATLAVGTIDAQYEISGQAEARPFFIAPNPSNSNVIFKTFTSILPDVFAAGSNRPTIGFVPGDDGDTMRRFLTPITADTLTFLVQTGWPVSQILQLWAERLNGIPNEKSINTSASADPAPGRFQRVIELFQSAVDRELLSLRVEERTKEISGPLPAGSVTAAAAVEAEKRGLELRQTADGTAWSLVRREKRLVVRIGSGAEKDPELLEVESLLNLEQGRSSYDLVTAPSRTPDPLVRPESPGTELHLTPRSTAQMFLYLAHHVQVPGEHIACGLAEPNVDACGSTHPWDLLVIRSACGHKPPACAYTSVPYRNWWYYIDDRDSKSKTTFALVLELSRLDLRRPPPGGPVLTLPAGR